MPSEKHCPKTRKQVKEVLRLFRAGNYIRKISRITGMEDTTIRRIIMGVYVAREDRENPRGYRRNGGV